MSKFNILWLDQQEAHLIAMTETDFATSVVSAARSHLHRHPKGSSEPKAHPDDEKRFFHEVAAALRDAAQILVVGPGLAKQHFVDWLKAHEHGLASKVVGVETMDHPTDAQLAAHARKYFRLDS